MPLLSMHKSNSDYNLNIQAFTGRRLCNPFRSATSTLLKPSYRTRPPGYEPMSELNDIIDCYAGLPDLEIDHWKLRHDSGIHMDQDRPLRTKKRYERLDSVVGAEYGSRQYSIPTDCSVRQQQQQQQQVAVPPLPPPSILSSQEAVVSVHQGAPKLEIRRSSTFAMELETQKPNLDGTGASAWWAKIDDRNLSSPPLPRTALTKEALEANSRSCSMVRFNMIDRIPDYTGKAPLLPVLDFPDDYETWLDKADPLCVRNRSPESSSLTIKANTEQIRANDPTGNERYQSDAAVDDKERLEQALIDLRLHHGAQKGVQPILEQRFELPAHQNNTRKAEHCHSTDSALPTPENVREYSPLADCGLKAKEMHIPSAKQQSCPRPKSIAIEAPKSRYLLHGGRKDNAAPAGSLGQYTASDGQDAKPRQLLRNMASLEEMALDEAAAQREFASMFSARI